MRADRRLIIVTGQEGAGKTTIVRALRPYLRCGAVIDTEDVGQVNPWTWDDAFKNLLWDNVAAIVRNFWQAGYSTVVAGSFINDYEDYLRFRTRLERGVSIDIVHLCASKPVRDVRRIARSKPTSKEWRDDLDRSFPEDETLQTVTADYRYMRIDNGALSIIVARRPNQTDASRRSCSGLRTDGIENDIRGAIKTTLQPADVFHSVPGDPDQSSPPMRPLRAECAPEQKRLGAGIDGGGICLAALDRCTSTTTAVLLNR